MGDLLGTLGELPLFIYSHTRFSFCTPYSFFFSGPLAGMILVEAYSNFFCIDPTDFQGIGGGSLVLRGRNVMAWV